MPINKNAYIRYRVIDSLLRNQKYVKTKHIIDKLWELHDLTVGSTSINKDIRDMQTDLKAPIDYSHLEKAYYYPDNVEELFPSIDLQEEEINALKFYADSLLHYKDIGIFKDFTNAIDKVVDAVKIQTSQLRASERIIIQPENFPKFQGSELIPTIITGFDSQFKFSFEYKKHTSDKVKNHIVTPILLKEFDHLWYLIGQIEGKDYITIFALDRISNFQLTNQKREIIKDFDSEIYFNHVFGIAVPDGEIEEVILEFDSWRGKYLSSAPIHKSQKFIKEENDKMYFSLNVIPFHELHAKILSYGNSVRVISPESLRLKIQNILQETLQKY